MWWSCFTWDDKGPFHIWKKETATKEKACKEDLNGRNATRYESDKAI